MHKPDDAVANGASGLNHHWPTQWARVLREIIRTLAHGWIADRAAQMSFYFFLSAFPSLLVLMSVLSQFRDAQQALRHAVVQHLEPIVPPSMLTLISGLLDHLAEQHQAILAWGVVVAAWAASSGMVVTIDGLNQAYAVTERRSWWRRRLVGLTLLLVVMLALAIAAIFLALGVPFAHVLAERYGSTPALALIWRLAQWPAILCFMLLAFDLLYHYGANHKRATWRWMRMESLIATGLLLAASFGLRTYMINFGNYSVIYGTLGGVIVLLLWFYLSAIAILIGALLAKRFVTRL